jgi:hypothetical protein
MTAANPKYWPSARSFNEAVQCPGVCFSDPSLRLTQPAVDRLGMPLVTSGQFAYVYKLKSTNGDGEFAVQIADRLPEGCCSLQDAKAARRTDRSAYL